jgi:hypothetical protein
MVPAPTKTYFSYPTKRLFWKGALIQASEGPKVAIEVPKYLINGEGSSTAFPFLNLLSSLEGPFILGELCSTIATT